MEAQESTPLVPVDPCIHQILTQSRQNDGSMRIHCQFCGKTIDFPMSTLMRSREDQSQLLRMTFGEAWVQRMGGV